MPEAHAALVLAGGHSRRMGQDKASLRFGPQPLLSRVVHRLRHAGFDAIQVIAAEGQPLPPVDAPVIRDRWADRGPLAGLGTGLAALDVPFAFVCACDMPFVSPQLALGLLNLAPGFDAVAPRVNGRAHPLCAVYARQIAPQAKAWVSADRLRMTEFLQSLRTRWVEGDELSAMEPSPYALSNINSPDELRQALHQDALEEALLPWSSKPDGRQPENVTAGEVPHVLAE